MTRWLRRRWALVAMMCVVLTIGGVGASLYLQGYRAYVVHTGSMEPTYVPGDLVIDGPAEHTYRVGDVITFRHSDVTTDLVTHRIVAITAKGLIHTKGDANATPDVWEIRPDQVRGTVSHRIRGAGFLVVFFRQPAGVATVATAVLAIAVLWQLFFPSGPAPVTERPLPRHRRPSPRPRPLPYSTPA